MTLDAPPATGEVSGMDSASPARLALAHLPTPIVRYERLDALVGTRLWVKRDDMTAGPEAGNKIRKLEYLLADAVRQQARAVITCGGFQSNHARATALLARRLGLRPVLLLRTTQAEARTAAGNAFLDSLCGAEVRTLTPSQYRERNALMQGLAEQLRAAGEPAYVIPEGGSNGLGALGYVDAVAEIRQQLDTSAGSLPQRFGCVAHACGSGGTAAGVALGNALTPVADRCLAFAVCDDRRYFESAIDAMVSDAQGWKPTRAVTPAPVEIFDEFKGPAYGIPSPQQSEFIAEVARQSGLILDPVYTGKALYGLSRLDDKPQDALFVHTGGLPGLLGAQEHFPQAAGHVPPAHTNSH